MSEMSSASADIAGERPLRIALLGYRSAPFSGGQGIYLRYLSHALTALGHQVTVVSGPPYPQLVDGVTLVKLPSLTSTRASPWWCRYRIARPAGASRVDE